MAPQRAGGPRPPGAPPVPHAAPAVPGENLVDHLRHWARWQPDRAAVRFEGRTVTWAELDHATDRLAAGLAACGAGAGDPVAILMGNRPEYVEAMLAILKLGAVVVPLNTRWTATELLHPLEDCGARLVLTEASTAETIEAAIRRLAAVRLVGADPVEGMGSFADLRGSGGPSPTRRIT